MPAHKGQPKAGGRRKGTPNKATADIKALAMKYVPDAMKALHKLATTSLDERVQLAAWKELLDRGVGKAVQPVSGAGDEAPPLRITIIEPRPSSERP